MSPTDMLVANRGEVAIRVMRAAAELGMRVIDAIYRAAGMQPRGTGGGW